MEGKGVTAAQSPSPGENGEQNEAQARGGELASGRGANSPARGNESNVPTQPSPGGPAHRSAWGEPDTTPNEWQRPRVRVDARLLEATLLNLHKRIAAVPLVFDIPGADG